MPTPDTITSSVGFQDPQGNLLPLGLLTFDLSQSAAITSGGGLIAPTHVAITLDSTAKIPAATLLWGNDQLTPSGTTYRMRLFNSNGLLIADYGQQSIQGTSPIDISLLTPTATSGGTVSYPNPAILTGNNAFTGNNTHAGTETFANINSVQYANATTTIQQAYAALPSTGGTVALSADITISSAQTLTLTVGKPLFLDLAGRTITFSHTSGVGLTIARSATDPRDPFEMANGIIKYSGASASITGIQFGNASVGLSGAYIHLLNFQNFSNSGNVAASVVNTEDAHFDSILFGNNQLALSLGLATNQNQFSNIWCQSNVNCLSSTDASGNTFINWLVQSSTGTTPFSVASSTVQVNNIHIQDCWFESNGDGTSASRQIVFNAGTGTTLTNVSVTGSQFEGNTNGNLGKVYTITGAGTFTSFFRYSNFYHNFAAGFQDGFSASQQHTSIQEIFGAANPAPVVNQLAAVETTAPDALNADVQNGHLLLGAGNVSTVFGQYPVGQTFATWLQARNRLGANNVAYPIVFNPLGGNVGVNNATPGQPLDVTGNVRSSTGFIVGAGSSPNVTQTIASGTATMTTALIGAGAVGATVTVAASGVATTDSIIWAYNAAPLVNPAELVISAWPTANNVNFQYANPTAAGITPNAATLNWRVVR